MRSLGSVAAAGAIVLVGLLPRLAASDEEFRPIRVVPAFPALRSFPVTSVREVGGKIHDAELVLGVVVEGQARAYPINMLTGPRREILNDTLGGRAIAATW